MDGYLIFGAALARGFQDVHARGYLILGRPHDLVLSFDLNTEEMFSVSFVRFVPLVRQEEIPALRDGMIDVLWTPSKERVEQILNNPEAQRFIKWDDVYVVIDGNILPYAGQDGGLPDDADMKTIDGSDGIDAVSYLGQRAEYEISLRDDGTITVAKSGSVDTLVSIERLEFSDGTLAFDFEGNAGQAYRLYQAAFDRLPDTEGLSYWISRLDSGTTSLNAVADSFIHSPEFVSTYGTEESVGNARFVELLYLHTLGREYDQSGFDYWVERLDGGHTNRGDLLAFFSESDENVARVAPAIQDGIWFV